MQTRSKRYFTDRKDKGSKKGSATNAGYDEQNEHTIKAPKENPAPSEQEDKTQAQVSKNAATQDDTGGGSNTGKRKDPH